jgi:hypothetical protein
MSVPERAPIAIDQILLDPAKYFATPAQAARSPDYSFFDRIRILERWRQDAKRLAQSTDEGMSGGEPSLLRDVELELANLED